MENKAESCDFCYRLERRKLGRMVLLSAGGRRARLGEEGSAGGGDHVRGA